MWNYPLTEQANSIVVASISAKANFIQTNLFRLC